MSIFMLKVLAEEPLIKPEHADCKNAIHIDTNVFGPTNPPVGYGEILEFSGNQLGDPYFIQREHHTVWYYFDIAEDGILTFDIVPESKDDDYDFLLFKYTGEDFCDKVKTQTIKPVRTNISRNQPEIGSRTGLAFGAEHKFVPAGPGDAYSKHLEVNAGERYYLLVDNVYDGGEGHTLYMYFPADHLRIQFGVKGELKEKEGEQVTFILSEAESGETILDTALQLSVVNNVIPVPESGSYYLSVISEGFFHETIQVTVPGNQENWFSPEKIAVGKSAQFQHINFYPNRSQMMPRSYPEVYRLFRTLEANPGLYVRIEGHVNSPHTDNLPFFQRLSESRAKTIRQLMIEQGIEAGRIDHIGFGNTRMLYPEATTSDEMRMNRRVEIRVTAFN